VVSTVPVKAYQSHSGSSFLLDLVVGMEKMKTRQLRVLKCPSLSVKLPLVQYLALLQLLQASLRFLCALCCFQCCQALLLQGSMLGRQTMAQISWKTKIKPSTPVLPIPKTEVEVVSNL
jgi:hypothetical protein